MELPLGILLALPALLVAAPSDPLPPPEDNPKPAPQSAVAVPAPDSQKSPERRLSGRIRGTVLGPANKPVAGLLVQCASKDEKAVLRVTGTDEKGQYIFQDLPPGTYELEVGAGADHEIRKGRIEVRPPFQNIVDFQIASGDKSKPAGIAAFLKARPTEPPIAAIPAPGAESAPAIPPVTVRGRFLDQQKRPIAEVSVTFVALTGKGSYQATSLEDGSFSIAAVPPGRYRALIASPGHVSLDLKSVEVAPVNGLDLGLLLVDYPLNFKGRDDDLPREEPRQPLSHP